MTSGLSSIALFAPAIASNAVFSFRRASRGVDAIDENPIYGMMNMDIAAAQTLKAAKATGDMVKVSDAAAGETIKGAEQAFKNIAQDSKFLKGAGKIVRFTADNINPIICATSGVKVLYSDDKTDALAREALALTTMFSAEAAAKKFLGMPITKKINGKKVTVARESLYSQNPFLKAQASAIKDYCSTTKLLNKISLKPVPGMLKGLAFVAASIAGYQAGSILGDWILGKNKS